MRKITALILATIMVALCFSLATTASAEDVNLLAGLAYTIGGDASMSTSAGDTTPPSLLTDGVVRTAEQMLAGGTPTAGVSVEFNGTGKTVELTFDFDEAVTIGSVVFDGVRRAEAAAGLNRDLAIASIKVSTDGMNYGEALSFTEVSTVIEGAQQASNADKTQSWDQYWTIAANLATPATGVQGLMVTLSLPKYVMQLDEIEAYATAQGAAVEESSEEAVESSEEAAESSEEAAESSEEAAESSEEEVVIPVAETTFTVEAVEKEDGSVIVTVKTPVGVSNGTIVLGVSEDLVLVPFGADDEPNKLGGEYNMEYSVDENTKAYSFNFAKSKDYDAEKTLVEFTFTLAEGATLDASDIIVYAWELGNAANEAFGVEDGAANVVVTPIVPEVESSEAEVSEESKGETPPTGDAGVAVFAVLALVSAAAVVVIKKRA